MPSTPINPTGSIPIVPNGAAPGGTTTRIAAPGTPGVATLGDLTFRVAPSQIAWEYHLDSTVINTIGGRVVQVYGATLGDMTVQGLFGQQASVKSGNTQSIPVSSMQEAKNFSARIAAMVDKQGARPTPDQLTRKDKTPMHEPFRFTYTGDGVHQWDFSVYIKSLADVNDPEYVISHKTGKYAYGYNLVLFIVEDHTRSLTQIATDAYIERLSVGIGWKRTTYNGPMSADELKAYLAANSPDGTIHGLVLKEYEDAAKGQIPDPGAIAANPIPGGADTAKQADIAAGGTGAGNADQKTAPPAPGAGGARGTTAVPNGGVIPGQNGGPPVVIPGLTPKG